MESAVAGQYLADAGVRLASFTKCCEKLAVLKFNPIHGDGDS
jgi:hypothetical protein